MQIPPRPRRMTEIEYGEWKINRGFGNTEAVPKEKGCAGQGKNEDTSWLGKPKTIGKRENPNPLAATSNKKQRGNQDSEPDNESSSLRLPGRFEDYLPSPDPDR